MPSEGPETQTHIENFSPLLRQLGSLKANTLLILV